MSEAPTTDEAISSAAHAPLMVTRRWRCHIPIGEAHVSGTRSRSLPRVTAPIGMGILAATMVTVAQEADNTKVHARDRQPGAVTADQ